MRHSTGPAYRTRTRLDRETAFMSWCYGARVEKLHERSVAELARDFGVAADFVKLHLAKRMAAG
jgi:hypothetical protein